MYSASRLSLMLPVKFWNSLDIILYWRRLCRRRVDLHRPTTGALTGHDNAVTHWSVSSRAQCTGHSSNVYVDILRQLHSAVMNIHRSASSRTFRKDTILHARRLLAIECNACNTPWTYLVVRTKQSPALSPNANADNWRVGYYRS